MFKFKRQHTFDQRVAESSRVLEKYSDRIPIICEKNMNQPNLPDIDKNKYLVPFDLTIGQFIYVIRKRLSILSNEALFLFIGNTIPPSGSMMSQIYAKYKDSDGFLYVTYSKENTFG